MLEEVRYVYFNSEAHFSSMVNRIDGAQTISNEIKTKMDALDEEISLFNNNFYDAINTNPSSVLPIYNALKELTTLFAVDVTSTLSVTVLPTDNDGD